MILAKQHLPKYFLSSPNREKSALVTLVSEVCLREGIGKLRAHQRVEYLDSELEIAKKITSLLVWIADHECKNFRTKEETLQLIKYLLNSLNHKKPLLLFALFCPSYKKGKSVVGFNTFIGETTKQGIDILSQLRVVATSLGFICDAQAIFCDLALEHSEKLVSQDLRDLESNFRSFVEYGEKEDRAIVYTRLSNIGKSSQNIGLQGISQGKILLNNEEIHRIVRRSSSFYEKVLGWKKEEIVKRTENLSRSCSVMCTEIISEDSPALMVMTESIYERALFYGYARKCPLPIFYPKKYDKLKVVIAGGPLSGKSTLGVRLARLMKVPYISAGRLIDSYFKRKGLTINHADTAPTFKDETLAELIMAVRNESGKEGFVLEGFPKYPQEFSLFERICSKADIAILLSFDEHISRGRLQGRRICSQCTTPHHLSANSSLSKGVCDFCGSFLITRDDDTEEIFDIRSKEYLHLERPLIRFLTSKAKHTVFLDSTVDVCTIGLEVLHECSK